MSLSDIIDGLGALSTNDKENVTELQSDKARNLEQANNSDYHLVSLISDHNLVKSPYKRPISFIFDTETTGLGADARIIEIAFIVIDANNVEIMRYQTLINHPGLIIKNAFIHHISTKMCLQTGIPIYDALTKVYLALTMSDIIVAHNLVFDIGRLKYESANVYPRICELIDDMRHFCTLRNISGVKGKLGAIYAGVNDSHAHEIGQAHRAMSDTLMCRAIYAHYVIMVQA